MGTLTCFKSYDIRGEIDKNFDKEVAYKIGRAVAQHFVAKAIVIGFDARKTSPIFAQAAAQGAMDEGANVFDLGLAGTEEMYWAVSSFNACAGIEVTASHNPIQYNGMKIVKSGSEPLNEKKDFKTIRNLAEKQSWKEAKRKGTLTNIQVEARKKYLSCILGFINVEKLRRLKIVINSGNGAAGPTFDAIANQLRLRGVPIEFVTLNHKPDGTFPSGIPNPMLPQNHAATADAVIGAKADMGVAFDGDFDRCFFFDDKGKFIPGEYIVGILGGIFLEKEPGGKIVHDPRVIWNTQNIASNKKGLAIQSKTGHAFIKKTMRDHDAIYGGEMSAHHYFRDFAYCDSGMIPWLIMAELISKSNRSLSSLVDSQIMTFPSSGEINFRVEDANASIEKVLASYSKKALSLEKLDGISLVFKDWRFNLRKSNTEPLIRLNAESRGHPENLSEKVNKIAAIIGGVRE